MDQLNNLMQGFGSVLTPMNLLWCLVGTTLGTADEVEKFLAA